MKSPLEALEKQIAEETSAKRSSWRKPRAIRSRTAAVSPATFLSAATISIEFTPVRRRARKIAPPVKNFCAS